MRKFRNWLKRIFICSWRNHHFRDTKGNRLYFCARCGTIDKRITIPRSDGTMSVSAKLRNP